jgi:hypothetical protein
VGRRAARVSVDLRACRLGRALSLLAFRDVYTRDPDGEGVVVFETRQPLREMATAVADGAQAVLDEYGADEYRRRWVDFPFPLGHLEVIRAHLGAE